MRLNTVTEEELAEARQCRAEAWAAAAGVPGHTPAQFEEWWGIGPIQALELMLDALALKIACGCRKCRGCIENEASA